MTTQPIGFINSASNCHINALMQALLCFDDFRRGIQLIPQNLEMIINNITSEMPIRVIDYFIKTVPDCSLEGGQDAISVDLFYLIDTLHKNLSDLFLFEIQRNLLCLACGYNFKKIDKIHIHGPSLDLFNNHLNEYRCDACGRRGTTVNNYLNVVKYPEILICSADAPGRIPPIPVRQLGKQNYILRSIINYPGRAHYNAIVKYSDNKVYYCDDSAIREMPALESGPTSLFCFYARIHERTH